MSWPGVALRTMPHPDITFVGLWGRLGLEGCPMKMTSQHGKIRQITPLCPKSIIYSKMHVANIQMLHACVKPESSIQG